MYGGDIGILGPPTVALFTDASEGVVFTLESWRVAEVGVEARDVQQLEFG